MSSTPQWDPPITALCELVERVFRYRVKKWRDRPASADDEAVWRADQGEAENEIAKLEGLYLAALHAATRAGYAPAEAERRLGELRDVAVFFFRRGVPRSFGERLGGHALWLLAVTGGYSRKDLKALRRGDTTDRDRERIKAFAAERRLRATAISDEARRGWDDRTRKVEAALRNCRELATAAGESAIALQEMAPQTQETVKVQDKPPPIEPRYVFAESRGAYQIEGFGESCFLADLVGLNLLASLLRSPGTTVPWGELDPKATIDGRRSDQPTYGSPELLSIRNEMTRLRNEIDEAENEVERADSERRLADLTARLNAATGLRGEPRDLNSLTDKLRPRIWGRIKKVYEKLRELKPKPMEALANHFESCIRSTADGFLYDPPFPRPGWITEPPENKL
jgi:hypothetical protein